ncbi:ATP-binding Cassette (ABC) Superfamily [Thraustotheca clavata]|uniref:ATP-binding Cassette (ABC) Superfamily n=1 Tax=Thraustotheca clavata TaxID=74557 RepID=A0A1W0A0T5_9STRA|nr:ATP-binding Cassette (ABC) Superfamily [Thraustotheca clavata]
MATTQQLSEDFLSQGSEIFHLNVAACFEASRGKSLPQLEIRLVDVAIHADVVVATKSGQGLPTLWNEIKTSLLGFMKSKHVVEKNILHPMSAVFKPCSMTLVLGQPGSGKSSLMKLLSGRFPMEKNILIDGLITYNGQSFSAVRKQIPQFASYVSQRDYHYPTLTVKETLEFAHACSGVFQQHFKNSMRNGTEEENESAAQLLANLQRAYPDIVTRQMGLKICEDTIVGNAMLRGVSGGERKRVTVGEMEFGMKMASFLDEISTGLDSAATFDIVKSQKSMAESLNKTIVIALLQPAPEVFDLFDELLLLNNGYVMYQGPRSMAVEYFESLGFKCPPGRDPADFLLDLGTQEQEQYVATTSWVPRYPSEYNDLFKNSQLYKNMLSSLNQPVSQNLLDEAVEHMNHLPVYQVPFNTITWKLVLHQIRVYLRNKEFVQSRLGMVIIMGLLYSTSFYQVNADQILTVLGVIFTTVLFLSLMQIPLLPSIIDAREIFYKHKSANFFPTFAYVFSYCLTQIPFAIAETLFFGSIMYWITGFTADAAAFILYLVLLLLTNLVFSTWFFFIGVVSPNVHVAEPLSLMCVLLYVAFAGFIVSADNLPNYLIWLYWIDPLAWSLRAIAINQYSRSEFQVCAYKGIDYCELQGSTFGNSILSQYSIKTNQDWILYAIIFLIVCYGLFMLFAYLALQFIRYDATQHSVTVNNKDEEDSNYSEAPKTPAVVVAVDDTKVVPVTLAFENLWYSVPNPTKGEPDLQLLKGISGYALPGTITALMGSSGAGKTTLMDVIAGRKTGGKIEGSIYLNGYPATDLAIRRATGYCEQVDIHSVAATFREAFQFSALLRQSDDISTQEKLAFAETCLDLLDMTNLGDKIIRGASVEQLKRLTIGVELAAAPSVLFLDEPTSGLDARSAKIIMTGIRKIASTGRTVVCTIHQPSTEVFMMFDSLLLLKRGGETVYFGDLGANAFHLINYFQSIPDTLPLLPGANPATWMLEVIGAGVEARSANQLDYVQHFNSSHERSCLAQNLEPLVKPGSAQQELTFRKKRAASSLTQLKVLTQRFFRLYWRTSSYNNTRVYISIFLAIFFGLIYRGVDYTTFSGATGGVGMIYVTSVFVAMISFYSVIPIAGEERASFYRERASQTYNSLWYFVAASIVEIPYVFFTTYLFTIIYYPFVGLNESVQACLYYGFNLSLLVLMNVYMGQFMSYSMPNVDVAGLVGFLFNSIFMLFMGFTPAASQIPSGYRWLYHITPPKYSLAILTAETFSKCTDGTQLGCKTLKNVPPTLLNAANSTTITVGQYVEYMFEMKYDDATLNSIVTVGYIILFLVLNVISLRFINHQKK